MELPAWVQVHDGPPGSDGFANQIGRIVRTEIAWRVKPFLGHVLISRGAVGTVRYLSFWKDRTGGECLGTHRLPNPVNLDGQWDVWMTFSTEGAE